MLHRRRDLLVRQRTMLVNALRAPLAELGIVAARGGAAVKRRVSGLEDGSLEGVPDLARVGLRQLAGHLGDVEARIKAVEHEILAWHLTNAVSRRLATIPGIAELSASAPAATVSDPSQFRSGRDLAASLGSTPRQHSTGGKPRLGRISKQGDRYVRCLLVLGATSLPGHSRARGRIGGDWFEALRARRPGRVATVTLANKMARITGAVLARGETFQARASSAAG